MPYAYPEPLLNGRGPGGRLLNARFRLVSASFAGHATSAQAAYVRGLGF